MGARSIQFPGALLLMVFLASPALAMTVDPNPLPVDARFDGGTVLVRGSTDPDSQVFVVVTGGHIKEKFNRKGRVGPVWANIGTLEVSGVPRLCLIASSGAGSTGLDRRLVDKYLLDLEAVSRQAILDPPGSDTESFRREYIKLKESQQVFADLPGTVHIATKDGQGEFSVAIPWPVKGGPDTYTIDVVQVKGGTFAHKETSTFAVKLVGFPRWVSYLAFERSRLYGVLSVASAIFVGLLMGLVFKKGGGH